MGRAVIKAENNLVEKQVQMWQEQAERAHEVSKLAYEHIKEKGFDTTASAVQALKWAQEEERKTRGVEAFYQAVKEKSNDELVQMIRSLAERQLSDDEVIEVTEEKDA